MPFRIKWKKINLKTIFALLKGVLFEFAISVALRRLRLYPF